MLPTISIPNTDHVLRYCRSGLIEEINNQIRISPNIFEPRDDEDCITNGISVNSVFLLYGTDITQKLTSLSHVFRLKVSKQALFVEFRINDLLNQTKIIFSGSKSLQVIHKPLEKNPPNPEDNSHCEIMGPLKDHESLRLRVAFVKNCCEATHRPHIT